MKRTYNKHELAAMKPQFIDWLEDHWCDCREQMAEDLAHDPEDDYWDPTTCETRRDGHPCNCYGRQEYDDVFEATVDDDTAIVVYYDDRTVTKDFTGKFRNLFITCDDFSWSGDDVDYYAPVIYFLAFINDIKM